MNWKNALAWKILFTDFKRAEEEYSYLYLGKAEINNFNLKIRILDEIPRLQSVEVTIWDETQENIDITLGLNWLQQLLYKLKFKPKKLQKTKAPINYEESRIKEILTTRYCSDKSENEKVEFLNKPLLIVLFTQITFFITWLFIIVFLFGGN